MLDVQYEQAVRNMKQSDLLRSDVNLNEIVMCSLQNDNVILDGDSGYIEGLSGPQQNRSFSC